MRIYFVRHGKTEWNLARRLQGQKGDSPLLPESYEAIERVHKFLEPIEFDKVLSSPQKRNILKKCMIHFLSWINLMEVFLELNL